MGRIAASVTIQDLLDPEKNIRSDALVATGASHMVLPNAWRDRLGDLREIGMIDPETATQPTVQMEPEEGKYEPLIGYIVLEQSQAAVDTFGHRLIHVKRLDLK